MCPLLQRDLDAWESINLSVAHCSQLCLTGNVTGTYATIRKKWRGIISSVVGEGARHSRIFLGPRSHDQRRAAVHANPPPAGRNSQEETSLKHVEMNNYPMRNVINVFVEHSLPL